MELSTRIAGITLRQIEVADVPEMYQLIQKNKVHLTRLGDYKDMVNASQKMLVEQLQTRMNAETTFGVIRKRRIIGNVSLIRHKPKVYGLGYWVDKNETGQGYVTESCRTIIDYAIRTHFAVEIWAGIRATNAASVAVVSELGFYLAREQNTHLSYRLDVEH